MGYTQERWCFDFEVFNNFACVTFVNVEKQESLPFVIWKNKDESGRLLEFLDNNPFLVSFNGISYDMPVLRFIRDYNGRGLNRAIYDLSAKLISDDARRDDQIMALRYPRYGEDYVHQDLMTMMNFHRSGVGLKQCSVNLKWKKIQDLPLHHEHTVTREDVGTILDYNLNDSLITLELYKNKKVTEARELRESVAIDFGNGILSASDSRMANIFLESLYEQETGTPKSEFKQQRTFRTEIKFSNVILPEISFSSDELSSLKKELENVTVLAFEDFKFEKSIWFRGNKYNFGVGGLHTDEKPAFYQQTNDTKIISMDVASFYPSIMCEYGIKPEHLDEKFLDILRRVMRERLEAKKSGDKTKAESYKIVVNSTFGKMGFPEYWLYDPLALLRVTVNGQLFLMMLVERMENAGIHCISANTDGIEIIVPNSMNDKAMQIAKDWSEETRFKLEFIEYLKYAKRDVNNYVAISSDGKKKTKGAFLDEIDLKKGYKYPIVPIAVNKYFLDGVPVEETINNCKDILDFCISQKVGKEFLMELQTLSGIKSLQKTNRFYVSNGGGYLRKRHSVDGRVMGLFVGKTVKILNDYDPETPFESYTINKEFYIKEAKDLIDEIQPSTVQSSLFDLNGSFGKRVNMRGEEISKKRKTFTTTTNTLADITEAHRTKRTFPVSPKYGLVTKVNTTYSPVIEIYSLAKGTTHTLKIQKKLFEKNPLHILDVVLLSNFEQKNKFIKDGNKFVELPDQKVWWLTGYSKVGDPVSILEKQ